MSDLFRDEALEHLARRRGGDGLHRDDAWVGRLFWGFVVLVVAGVAITALVVT